MTGGDELWARVGAGDGVVGAAVVDTDGCGVGALVLGTAVAG